MKDRTDQHLDNLTKKMMTNIPLEQPSLDFTANVMSQIEAISVKEVHYKPLISKTSWFIIGLLFVSAVLYVFFSVPTETSGWFQDFNIDYSALTDNRLTDSLSSISISNIVMYAVALFGLMFLIQITFLKKYHNRQLGY